MKEPNEISSEVPISLPPSPPEPSNYYVPKTDFGRELLAMRQKAIANGMKLMTNDEILAEIEYRRYGRKIEGYDENSYLY